MPGPPEPAKIAPSVRVSRVPERLARKGAGSQLENLVGSDGIGSRTSSQGPRWDERLIPPRQLQLQGLEAVAQSVYLVEQIQSEGGGGPIELKVVAEPQGAADAAHLKAIEAPVAR